MHPWTSASRLGRLPKLPDPYTTTVLRALPLPGGLRLHEAGNVLRRRIPWLSLLFHQAQKSLAAG